ncbi:MAG: carboxymuconolactone decarboxylase family protein [Planctomycetales bacterium]|nr:carboxymuconolactone decarboxylase family protein [Planctomycetales bacterium]
MQHVDALRATLPESTKDLRLNLSSVLGGEVLSAEQTWSVALTAAYFLRSVALRDAVLADAREKIGEGGVADAQAAAAIMAMNTVLYRSRHMIGKESYHHRRVGLRMNRMAAPATSKAQFELCSLACAALAGCEACLKSHEESVLKAGLSEEHVHEALRIAAVLNGVATAADLRETA